jgi:hypothetical protein
MRMYMKASMRLHSEYYRQFIQRVNTGSNTDMLEDD